MISQSHVSYKHDDIPPNHLQVVPWLCRLFHGNGSKLVCFRGSGSKTRNRRKNFFGTTTELSWQSKQHGSTTMVLPTDDLVD